MEAEILKIIELIIPAILGGGATLLGQWLINRKKIKAEAEHITTESDSLKIEQKEKHYDLYMQVVNDFEAYRQKQEEYKQQVNTYLAEVEEKVVELRKAGMALEIENEQLKNDIKELKEKYEES